MNKTMYAKWKSNEISLVNYRNYLAKERGFINDIDYKNMLAIDKGFESHSDYCNYLRYRNGTCLPMAINKECPNYLGIHISERLLSKIWDNVIRMPNGNRGYDFICGKGYKIDVKSSCIENNMVINKYNTKYHYNMWNFRIGENKIADYFLLLAFDNRESLNPLHIWLIKGDELINGRKLKYRMCFKITNSLMSIRKFKKYEMKEKLDELSKCCNTFKSNDIDNTFIK